MTYDENARNDVEALMFNTLEHFIFQGTDLIQDVNNLATSVRVTQDIVLSKVAMWGEDDNIEHHGDSS